MSLVQVYNGKTTDYDVNGINTVITYTGTKAECETWAAGQTIGATYAGLGKLASVTVSQDSGAIYHVSAKYQNANGTSGTSGSEVEPPDYTYGEFSAQLDCTMLSTPLEQHPSYRTEWNYYLCARDDAPAGTTVPSWAHNVTTPMIQGANADYYRWVSYASELPQEDLHKWVIIQTPTMNGYQSYDRALYTQTESARFRTRELAVSAVSGYANKRGTPINNPGSPFVDGNWKCDRATVEWSGEFWRATLTWTYSPDGWNSTLYGSVS